jgi:hypothetical protein
MAGSKRFGHTTDFAALFASQSESRDYITGLVWLALTFGIIFLVWIITILVFCMFGKKRVGFLSGKPFERKHYYYSATTGHSERNLLTGSNGNSHNGVNHNLQTGSINSNNNVENKADFFEQSMTTNQYEINDGVSPQSPFSTNNNDNNTSHHRRLTASSKNVLTDTTINDKEPSCCKVDLVLWIRSIFIVAAVIFIVFSWLFVTLGKNKIYHLFNMN